MSQKEFLGFLACEGADHAMRICTKHRRTARQSVPKFGTLLIHCDLPGNAGFPQDIKSRYRSANFFSGKFERDEQVIERIATAQREELEREIAALQAEAEQVSEEARELAGEVPF